MSLKVEELFDASLLRYADALRRNGKPVDPDDVAWLTALRLYALMRPRAEVLLRQQVES